MIYETTALLCESILADSAGITCSVMRDHRFLSVTSNLLLSWET